jgi:ABC-type multidrug transport system ATPase subunit
MQVSDAAPPPALSFDNITVSVPDPTSSGVWARARTVVCGGPRAPSKPVLKGVSGAFPAGSLVAVIGASGAGKSTLLGALSHRLTGADDVTGSVRLHGRPLRPSDFRKVRSTAAHAHNRPHQPTDRPSV